MPLSRTSSPSPTPDPNATVSDVRCVPQYEHAASVSAFSAAIIMLSTTYDGVEDALSRIDLTLYGSLICT